MVLTLRGTIEPRDALLRKETFHGKASNPDRGQTGALIPEKAKLHKGLAGSIEDKSKSDDADEKAVAEGVLDLDGRNE